MKRIDSMKDPLFQQARFCRSKQGQESTQRIPIEEALIFDALRSEQAPISLILVSDLNWWKAYGGEEFGGFPHAYQISQGLMRKLYPQGRLPAAMALAEIETQKLKDLGFKRRLVVLEDIQDAGNFGCIVRTAEALAYEAVVVLSKELTHMFSRNAVRSSMGSFFRIPLCKSDHQELLSYLRENEVNLVCTSPHAKTLLDDFDPRGKALAVAFGNESAGASEQLQHMAHHNLSVPMQGSIESMNVAVASGIFLYALR